MMVTPVVFHVINDLKSQHEYTYNQAYNYYNFAIKGY